MNEPDESLAADAAVAWLRQVSPYFSKHRGKTFVVYLDDCAIGDAGFDERVRDLVLLATVGIRLVVVFGARAHIERRLGERGIRPRMVGEMRVTDMQTMTEVREVVGAMRLTIESAFSISSRSGLGGAGSSRIAGGNFVKARPAGIIAGVDLMFTGLIRSVDRKGLEARLDRDEIVLLAPLGYSSTGELFNLNAQDLAVSVASEIGATKLVVITDVDGIPGDDGSVVRQLTVREARELRETCSPDNPQYALLDTGIRACQLGVERVHIVGRHRDGAILRELFTRDGIGTMVSNAPFDQLRQAAADDVGSILELIAPLEDQGLLVTRSRETLEDDISHFIVMVRESTVVACGALYPYAQQNSAEIACIAVHADYRGGAFGDVLLDDLERRARDAGLTSVFVLTTQATQWFNERGYAASTLDDMPVEKRERYNYQRNSAVLLKKLD